MLQGLQAGPPTQNTLKVSNSRVTNSHLTSFQMNQINSDKIDGMDVAAILRQSNPPSPPLPTTKYPIPHHVKIRPIKKAARPCLLALPQSDTAHQFG